MARENIPYFEVDSNDHCFFCLTAVQYETPRASKELRTFLSSPFSAVRLRLHSPILHSVHYLSKYLQIDMSKVFTDNTSTVIPSELLDKVQRSKLKVQLCSSCASVSETFSGLYRELEKIQLQMVSCVELINTKLLESEVLEADMTSWDWNKSSYLNMSQKEIIGKQEDLEGLRKETMLKCSHKLETAPLPRVKVQKLTPKQLKIHMGSNCDIIAGDNLVEEEVKIKLEEPYPDLNLSSPENDPLADYFENYNPPNDPIADSQGQEMVSVPELDMESHEPIKGQLNVKPVERRRKYKIDCPYVIVRPPQASTEIDSTFDLSTGRLQCNLCPDKQFKSYVNLKSHHRSVHGMIKYKCKRCGMEFPRGDICTRHHRSVHMPKTEDRYQCIPCDKTFPRKDHLAKHLRSWSCKTITERANKKPHRQSQREEMKSESPSPEGSLHSEIEISDIKLEPQL